MKDYPTGKVTATAHANIALVKYWGKRSVDKNLPAVGSISLTLDALKTTTSLEVSASYDDQFFLNGNPAGEKQAKKVSAFLDLAAGSIKRPSLVIRSENNFPTGAGLASSASGFAALAGAASRIFGKDESPETLSRLSRQGSGSAARSVYGGFVEMKKGSGTNDDEDYAIQLHDKNYLDLRLLIAVVSDEAKKIGSTEGMNRTAETAPFYQSWVESSEKDLADMRSALQKGDFRKIGSITEHSCFKMHGLAMAANPPLLYWIPATVESIQAVWGLRSKGIQAFVTIDAGPQVKVLCLPQDSGIIRETLNSIDGVKTVIEARPGPGISVSSSN